MALHPYVFFSNDCREAFTYYQKVFGGELNIMTMGEAPADSRMPGAADDTVMHAALRFGDDLLMGSDDPTGDGGPKKGLALSYDVPDQDEAKRIFEALADGGEVTMPIQPTFWSPLFGMCIDRFGVPWMISAGSIDQPES